MARIEDQGASNAATAHGAGMASQPPLAATPPTLLHASGALGLVIMVVLVGAWLLRRLGATARSSDLVRVVGGTAVGARERVVVVEVGGTWIVTGVAQGQVTALHTMPKPELPSTPDAPTFEGRSFQHWLKALLERGGGG
jgi:flagellar protein FliO/FliZ